MKSHTDSCCFHDHNKHSTLKSQKASSPFKCDGCKEAGIGSSYKCASCNNFDLHAHCAIPAPWILHPFYTKCSFEFMSEPPGEEARYCNACEKMVTGFIYHCKKCGFDLHPCCAKLPMLIDHGQTKLYLHSKVASPCHRCGRTGRSWSYRSSCKKYNLHVACVKEMLLESWHQLYYDGGATATAINNNRIPASLLSSYHHHHKTTTSTTKAQKCCEIAALALQFVISALLGDPTTLIAGIVGSLFSK